LHSVGFQRILLNLFSLGVNLLHLLEIEVLRVIQFLLSCSTHLDLLLKILKVFLMQNAVPECFLSFMVGAPFHGRHGVEELLLVGRAVSGG